MQNKPQLAVDSGVPAAAVPQPGDVVTCRVTRVQRDKATVEIVCVGAQKLNNAFQGVVRNVDVRSLETDKVRHRGLPASVPARVAEATLEI